MRTRAKVDANHAEIVDKLRQCGMSVLSLAAVGKGCPDILVGWHGINVLLEIKDPSKPLSKRKLTPCQVKFHAKWAGRSSIVSTFEGAFFEVISAAKKGSWRAA